MNTSAPGKDLVFCPTYTKNGVDQVRPETLESIKALQGNYDFVLSRHSPFGGGGQHAPQNILAQYQLARKMFLEGEYEDLLTVEHDMIVPSDELIKLKAVPDAAAVYGVYVLRHGARVLNTWRHTSGMYVGMSLTLFPLELRKAKKDIIYRVSGVGMGCTLFRRFALETIEFRLPPTNTAAPDIPFAEDCIKKGFKSYARFDVECGHITSDGTVLWPNNYEDSEAWFMRKCKIIHSFNGEVDGKSVHFESGAEVEIPEFNAMEWKRAGFLRMLEERKVPGKDPVAIPEPKAVPAPVKKTPRKRTTKASK